MAIDHGRPRRSPITWLYRDAGVDHVALGEAAEIDAHAVATEAHAARAGVEDQVLPADGLARTRQRGRIGRHAFAVVIEMADAGECDVERAVGQAREVQRALDQAEQLGTHGHRLAAGVAVDARKLRVALVRAHQAVDAVHLRHHGVDRVLGGASVLAPQLHMDGRAHDRLVAAEPAAQCGRGCGHGRGHGAGGAGAQRGQVQAHGRWAWLCS
jgi:hypothetical protein